MYNLTDRNIILGVSGSIAAYKAADLASKLTQAGARLDVVLTPVAERFVTSLTFQSVTGRRAYVDMFDTASGASEQHVELARRAHALLVAPATATTIARIALGLAEDMLSLTALATHAPIVICPAMDPHMYEHEATQGHLETLLSRGVHVVGPDVGRLASGHTGPGRMSDVDTIIGGLRYVLGRYGDLAAKKVVVSAGGTQEPIDPVRYVGNYSSGKMGYALAEAARDRGADVALVSGAVALPVPYAVRAVFVRSAAEMRDAVVAECADADALIMAAAVADYQPAEAIGQKMKRRRESFSLPLVRTPDILAEVGHRQGLVRVGFAAESEDLLANARHKLEEKGLELIVANDVTADGCGFGSDTNKVTLIDRQGEEELTLMPKYDVAARVLDRVVTLVQAQGARQ
jgi:phosphopantothenoylcysteine decarboxylase/phosphopantothenate--cysteine ligase